MPLVGPRIEDNPALREIGRDLLPSTFLEAARAGAEEILVRSPTDSLLRMSEFESAQDGQGQGRDSAFFGDLSALQQKSADSSRRLTESEWRASATYREGLQYVPGMTERLARVLAERKDAERLRADILARSPDSLLFKGGVLATQIVAALADPLNVAAAFVPVVGGARFAAMTARLGRTAARFGKGAIEGAAGAALVEPVVLAAARQEQADYDMTDSLLNIAFGTVFGGGLHVGAGAVGDYLARLRPEVREQALRTAVAQAADGRPVNVDPVLRAAGAPPERAARSLDERMQTRGETFQEALQEIKARLLPEAGNALSRGEVKTLRAELADISYRIQQTEAEGPGQVKAAIIKAGQTDARGRPITGRKAKRQAEETVRSEVETLKARKAEIERRLERHQVAAEARSVLSRAETFERQGRSAEEIVSDILPQIQSRVPSVSVDDVAGRMTPDRLGVGPAQERPLNREDLRREVQANESPEADPLADVRAAARAEQEAGAAIETADEAVGEAEKRAMNALRPERAPRDTAADEELQALARELEDTLTPEEKAALADADALVREAEAFESAARVAANCLARAA